ncbi:hypothetical protein ACIGCM_07380 [Pseudomonas sp. NPDC078700]|uniref:hypothetical protein n=1 Tax=Pseudomonas sp. NPDC078700 TaxID=3364424 RepID=UPI0037C88D9B
MRGSEREGGQYSTPDIDDRPRPWLRVIGSLAIFGFLIGLMFGDLFHPDALRLDRVEVQEDQLQLWFNEQPTPQAREYNGAYLLRLETLGREQQGQLQLNGRAANWRLQRDKRELLLTVLAARPLRGEWRADEVDGQWRLTVSLMEQ